MAVVLILCKSSRLFKLILRDLRSFCRTDTIVVYGRPRVGLVGAYASIDVCTGDSGLSLSMCPSKVSRLFLILVLSFFCLFCNTVHHL